MPVEIPSMSIMLHRSWWVLLLRGAAAIIFGVLVNIGVVNVTATATDPTTGASTTTTTTTTP